MEFPEEPMRQMLWSRRRLSQPKDATHQAKRVQDGQVRRTFLQSEEPIEYLGQLNRNFQEASILQDGTIWNILSGGIQTVPPDWGEHWEQQSKQLAISDEIRVHGGREIPEEPTGVSERLTETKHVNPW